MTTIPEWLTKDTVMGRGRFTSKILAVIKSLSLSTSVIVKGLEVSKISLYPNSETEWPTDTKESRLIKYHLTFYTCAYQQVQL